MDTTTKLTAAVLLSLIAACSSPVEQPGSQPQSESSDTDETYDVHPSWMVGEWSGSKTAEGDDQSSESITFQPDGTGERVMLRGSSAEHREPITWSVDGASLLINDHRGGSLSASKLSPSCQWKTIAVPNEKHIASCRLETCYWGPCSVLNKIGS